MQKFTATTKSESYYPKSTIGAVPTPVSATWGSSTKRAAWSASSVMPSGSAALSPASIAAEARVWVWSPPAWSSKAGSAASLPLPGKPHLTIEYETLAPGVI